MRSRIVLAATIAAVPVVSHPIVRRHDKPDSAYLTDRSRFPCVGRVSGFAEGTLIGDRWVITASHVAMGLNPFNGFVDLGGKRYLVTDVIFHPKGDMNRESQPIDLAILKLDRPVKGVTPATLYSGSKEVGKQVIFVGAGQTGDGQKEPSVTDGKTRVAGNVCDGVDAREISFTFDAPPKGLTNEGISGPGDSGGPALIKAANGFVLLGVSNRNSKNPGQGHCMYGTKEYYARISTQRGWILGVMKGANPSNWGWNKPAKSPTAGPKTDCINEFVSAFNSADRARMEAFDKKWRTPAALARRTPDQRWATVAALFKAHGKLTPLAYASSKPGSIAVKFKKSKGTTGLALEFMFPPADGGGEWTSPGGTTTQTGNSSGSVKFAGFTLVEISLNQ